MKADTEHVALVRQIWSSHVEYLGEETFSRIASDPKGAKESISKSAAVEDALRFDVQFAVELIVAALTLAKVALEVWQTVRLATVTTTAKKLDELIRERLKDSGMSASLLESGEYQALLKKLTE